MIGLHVEKSLVDPSPRPPSLFRLPFRSGRSGGLPIPRPRAILLVTAVYAARIVSRDRSRAPIHVFCGAITRCDNSTVIIAMQCGNNRIGAAARACLSAACIRVRPANEKRMAGERRTRNNQRVDRTDEWDTTVEDTVRSIDGTGACNVN